MTMLSREDHAKKLAALVDTYLRKRDISLREFARRTGLSHSYVYKITKGFDQHGVPVEPKMEILKILATGMNLSLPELLEYCGYLDSDEERRSVYSFDELLDKIPEEFKHMFTDKNERYIRFADEVRRQDIDPEQLRSVLREIARMTHTEPKE